MICNPNNPTGYFIHQAEMNQDQGSGEEIRFIPFF
jgi:hypothetical protein